MIFRHVLRGLHCALAVLVLGCDAEGTHPTQPNDYTNTQPPPGLRAEFTFFPVEMTADGTIEPLGHLAPTPHTLPTDHVYFYPVNYDKATITPDTIVRKVFAPAGGTAFIVLGSTGTDYKLMFRTTKDFYWYVAHVFPRAGGFKVGDVVQAGEVIGTTGRGAAIDLGAFDTSQPMVGYVAPNRNGVQTNYCVSPFRYFVEPLRSQLYARIRRKPGVNPVDPKINFDVAGRLVGNWYEDNVLPTPEASGAPDAWVHHLAFVYDNYDPAVPRVSIGGSISAPFLGTIPPDAPPFESISVASGKVTYSIRYTGSSNFQFGLMIVQMLADDRIKVEIFENQTQTSADFDSRAHIYVR